MRTDAGGGGGADDVGVSATAGEGGAGDVTGAGSLLMSALSAAGLPVVLSTEPPLPLPSRLSLPLPLMTLTLEVVLLVGA